MSPTVRIADNVFERLKTVAEPFVDTPSDAIEKLLDFYDSHKRKKPIVAAMTDSSGEAASANEGRGLERSDRKERVIGALDLTHRRSRERGAIVQVDDQIYDAPSVADLYGRVLRYLCDKGHMERIKERLPIKTSSLRYLLAREPIHPRGNEFVRPVQYRDYFMEAHKPWNRALEQLEVALKPYGISVKYIGRSKFS